MNKAFETATIDSLLALANERGYELTMHSGDKSWYAFYNERYQLNLELYVHTERFIINHMKDNIRVTTDERGSFENDEHFKRVEKAIRKVVLDLI